MKQREALEALRSHRRPGLSTGDAIEQARIAWRMTMRFGTRTRVSNACHPARRWHYSRIRAASFDKRFRSIIQRIDLEPEKALRGCVCPIITCRLARGRGAHTVFV
jgi:hypothetical protein